ncbi:hypothetical protein [Flectobacillus roseus]|uniref:hypothetical protein n=1 Tax=Flectobacillus roseus TaxID=502259 RepID=UPI0024B644B1|nr:hypothetical protein [Flectobacillus roseus]MDI9871378.1 hypothetical protein [Flectobacillus roseus]
MNSQETLQNHINSLQQRPDYAGNTALKHIVGILMDVKSQAKLHHQESLFSRMGTL